MIQKKDYILRIIEAAGKAIAKMIGFKEQGSYAQALETLDDCYLEHFDEMHIESETNSTKLDLYGSLLKQEAEINQELGNKDKSQILFLKALDSFKKAEAESKSFDLKRNSLMEEIKLSLT